MTMLSIAGLCSGYGKIEVLHDVALSHRAGADRHADRRQRRGKDDAAQDHFRADPADGGRDRVRGQEHRPPSAAQDRWPRPEPGAGRPRHPQAHDGDGQPAHGRLHAPRSRRSARTSMRCFERFPALAERRDNWRERSPAASSRCWRSAARWSRGPALLLLDEPSLGLAPKFITRIFLTLRELRAKARPSFWSSRMPARRCRSPTAAMSWSAAGSS